ncbi:RagB/SusD family nutrient uptake outer membrane protein [Geofilum sp. OHC36d9]|uniref:RagB/SusD family nutrient uptake outer membrane protein n=1 Tax=Geofilum sp. OHC36d9 TaxID=3458413 RepID=UPI0040346579
MKIKYFILALLTFVLGSCSESFLELENPNKVTNENFWQTEDDLYSAVATIYNSLIDDYTGHYGTINWELKAGRTENFTIRNDVRDRYEISTFLNTFSNGSSSDLYKGCYEGIFRANQVIQKGPEMEIDENVKNQLIAEARFLRGLNYMILAIDFGSVPITTALAATSDDYYQSKSTIEAVWEQCISDFDAALKVLPTQYDANQKGRATKGTVLAYMGRAYLYQGLWENAETTLELIVGNETQYGYALQPVYAELFDGKHENGVESVFELQFSLLGGTDIWTDNPASKSRSTFIAQECAPGEVGGWFELYPTKALLNAFLQESTVDGGIDPRATATLAWDYPECVYYQRIFNTTWGPDEIWLKKNQNWWNENEGDWKSELNEYGMRYADVLLMLAEAYTMRDKVKDAAPLVHRIRERAQLTNKLTEMESYNREQMMTEIRHQRNLEFAREGLHFYDLRRWDLLEETLDESQVVGYQNFAPKHKYYPIPENELDNNPNMKQNSPW